MCRAVVVATGTVGFEAALRGIPVLSDSAPYYAPAGTLLPLAALDGALPAPRADAVQQRRLMAHVLRGVLPGRFLNNGRWSAGNPQHVAWSHAMAASIRRFLEREADKEADKAAFEGHP